MFIVVHLKGNSALSSTFLETASVINFFASDRRLFLSDCTVSTFVELSDVFWLLVPHCHGVAKQIIEGQPQHSRQTSLCACVSCDSQASSPSPNSFQLQFIRELVAVVPVLK